MALTFGDFLSIFTTNDASGGRAIKATFDSGIDDVQNYLTKSDPAGGRAIKVVNVGAPLGPQFWTEAYTATTQATSSWTPTGAATNINAAIIPKGTGAITAAIPDGTVTGGNARGANSVDFLTFRNNANQVASGFASFLGSGAYNRVTGSQGGVVVGQSNVVSSQYGFIGAGFTNSVSGDSSAIVTGQNNSVTTNNSFIGGGTSNTASGSHSVVGGGQSNTASGNQSAVFSGNGNNCSGGGQSVICGGLTNSVAGQQSAICGGRNNSIGGGGDKFAFIGAGYLNSTASGNKTAIVGGQENTATSEYSVVVGGLLNASSGNRTFIGCGERNTASGQYSSILGGYYATASLYGQQAYAAGRFSANGDAQAHELIWRNAITGTATTELFLDGSSAAAILPSTNAIWHGVIDVAAVCTAAGDGSTAVGAVEASSFKVTIKRIGTTTSLVGTVQEIGTVNADASMATSVVTIDNNDTNESLRIQFTPPGTAGSTTVIRVVATFRGLQIQY